MTTVNWHEDYISPLAMNDPGRKPWTFALRRWADHHHSDYARYLGDGVVFGDGVAVMHKRDSARTVIASDLRELMDLSYCGGIGATVIWTSGGPPVAGTEPRHSDTICAGCYAPMVEVDVVHSLIRTEGHCPDCGTREVWTLH